MIPLPKLIEDNYKEVPLASDILHVNRVPFLATISRAIHYGTVTALPTMTLSTSRSDEIIHFTRIHSQVCFCGYPI
jgi:hypothetical protein